MTLSEAVVAKHADLLLRLRAIDDVDEFYGEAEAAAKDWPEDLELRDAVVGIALVLTGDVEVSNYVRGMWAVGKKISAPLQPDATTRAVEQPKPADKLEQARMASMKAIIAQHQPMTPKVERRRLPADQFDIDNNTYLPLKTLRNTMIAVRAIGFVCSYNVF
jgi:hypothetical protein